MPEISKIFEKIAHESVADVVVEEIENMIINGVLSDGDRLPSERELSELMKVSRPKIREALKKLVAGGAKPKAASRSRKPAAKKKD